MMSLLAVGIMVGFVLILLIGVGVGVWMMRASAPPKRDEPAPPEA